ncbi:MAG: YlmC/YmxH family sporulation protein [Clostridia bacterium]|nr:YlmC/YmxH family sporulation protein [Clostridia bacterium]MBR2054690.1 YlmC/YmxH family sporulation protein [Clostridia bacterium]MBR6753845.1 YlmC/YmxH family sporulation protein [Clostridia bacterium]
MDDLSLSELRAKDVVNTLDGKRLGKVMDIEFNACTGQVEALVIPGEFRISDVIKGEKTGIVIPWCNICKIGENVILVQVDTENTPET